MRTLALLLMLSWSALAQADKPTISADQMQLLRNGKVLLDALKDGFMHVSEVHPAPNGRYFLAIACGFECVDNIGFLFNADGTRKRRITPRGSYIMRNRVEWAADSRYVYYFRINSTAADSPPHPPREEWKQVHVLTGAITTATTRRLKPQATYIVFRPWGETLNVRAAPHTKANIVGTLPFGEGGVQFTGETRQVGKTFWAKIKHGNLTGWVNQNYLCEDAS
ncbi:MAG TPA: SH3 domain-containing protein [Blastocatellia bacterium]|nr:SH3 domain-containing protein [Blastocatellia bacterium]